MTAPATLFFGVSMNGVTIPNYFDLEFAPPAMALYAELGLDCRSGLYILLSFAAKSGAGPHHPLSIEKVCGWTGATGKLIDALIETEWLSETDAGGVFVRPWQDVVGGTGMAVDESAPANETDKERERRLSRERSRRYRQCKKDEVETHHGSVTVRHGNVTPRVTVASRHRDDASRFVTENVTPASRFDASSRTRSLSLSTYSEKYSEEEQEAEAEEENVGSIASVPVTPASPAGIGAAPRSTPREAIDSRLPFALTPPDATDRTTAIGQERPVVGSGSTIGAEVRSVPVPTSDRASESNSGGPAKKARSGKKAAVDPAVVDEPVRQVWNAYAEVVGTRVVLSQERAALIAARLSDGWTAEELIEAVRGFGRSKWHFGANKEGTRYTSIELWLRDAQHVEQGLGFHKEAAKANAAVVDVVKNPPRRGFEEKFANYFAEKRLKEAEEAAKGQS